MPIWAYYLCFCSWQFSGNVFGVIVNSAAIGLVEVEASGQMDCVVLQLKFHTVRDRSWVHISGPASGILAQVIIDAIERWPGWTPELLRQVRKGENG